MNNKLFIAIFLLWFSPLTQADFESGGEAYKRGDYETAAREFLPLAESGDHRAMYALGSMYAVGHGVPQDLGKSLEWFQAAAKYGRPDAEYKLGIMYADGLGVPQDYNKAARWFGRSAKKGYGDAQYRIGQMYMEGQGVKQDYIKAYAWSYVALAQGITDAKTNMDLAKENLTPTQLDDAESLAETYQSAFVKH